MPLINDVMQDEVPADMGEPAPMVPEPEQQQQAGPQQASPEEQEAYDRVVLGAAEILYDEKTGPKVEQMLKDEPGDRRATLEGLRGKVAIANAKLAYQHYLSLSAGDRWQKFAKERHSGGCNILYADGHSKWGSESELLTKYISEQDGFWQE